jgi:hypothetical protein
MARKKLLSEGEIRQFMKLANLRPIAQGRLREYSAGPGDRDEDEELERELGDEDRFADEEGAELDVADDELAAMDDAPVDPEKQEMLSNVVMAVADALGIGDQVDVDVEGDVGAPEELEVADVDVMGTGPEGGEMEEFTAEDELVSEIVRRLREKKKSNRKLSGAPPPSQEKIVAEVAKRVARRLQRENKKEKVADQLAERIMKRLTK